MKYFSACVLLIIATFTSAQIVNIPDALPFVKGSQNKIDTQLN
ncbi:MAG: hypothetical protein ABIN36_16735 [Ferruginibacter sp.]